MAEKDYHIDALTARAKADTSPVFLKRIYKAIGEEAEEGSTKLTWAVHGKSKTLLTYAEGKLREDGYRVSRSCDADYIVIEW